MGRIGFRPGPETVAVITQIAACRGLRSAAFYHLATADETDKGFAREQLRRFLELTAELERLGIRLPIKHAANSAALLDMPEAHLDLVRPGIALYGLYPSHRSGATTVRLRPAMALKARVVHIKQVEPGTGISYGQTCVTRRPTVVARCRWATPTATTGCSPTGGRRCCTAGGRRCSPGVHGPADGGRTDIPGVAVGDEPC
jgi:alanine racemase